jgi:hypothetical protein
MLFQGQVVAALAKFRSTGNPNILQLWNGENGVSQVMPRYSALAKSGFVFSSRGAAQVLSLAGVAMTGLALWNSSSGSNAVDLHLLKLTGNVIVTSATMTGIALAYGKVQNSAPTGPVAAQQNNDLIGNPVGAGLAYTTGTFTNAPVAQLDLLHNTAAIAATGVDTGFSIDLEGSVIVPPGMYVCFVALGAASAAAAVNLSIKHAELPV